LIDWAQLTESLIEWLLPLFPPFFGVLLAFAVERLWKRREESKEKQKFLKSIKKELETCSSRLDGKGRLMPTDMWNYGISSGSIRLLSFETKIALAKIYTAIQFYNYEAKRVRDVSILSATTKEKPRIPVDAIYEDKPIKILMTHPEFLHTLLSDNLRKNEKGLRDSINKLLKQNIWDC